TSTLTPCSSARRIRSSVRSALWSQSATRMAGTAAATRRNPWWVMTRPVSGGGGGAPPPPARALQCAGAASAPRRPAGARGGPTLAAGGPGRLPQVHPDVAGVPRPGRELHQRLLVRRHRRLVLPQFLLGLLEFLLPLSSGRGRLAGRGLLQPEVLLDLRLVLPRHLFHGLLGLVPGLPVGLGQVRLFARAVAEVADQQIGPAVAVEVADAALGPPAANPLGG